LNGKKGIQEDNVNILRGLLADAPALCPIVLLLLTVIIPNA